MQKRGMTLIELIVAVTIFVVVMTLAVGAYVTISRSRILIGNMKDTQQKVRVADEMIIRLAKQAEYANISTDGKTLELYFDTGSAAASANKFALDQVGTNQWDLKSFVCTDSASAQAINCSNWGNGSSLLGRTAGQTGGIVVTQSDVFKLSGLYPSVLNLTLNLKNLSPGFAQAEDTISLSNSIILESLR